MKLAFQTQIEMVIETCVTCGCVFGVEASLHQSAIQQHGKSFFCPNGHSQSYRETENAKLQKQLTETQKKLRESEAKKNYYQEVALEQRAEKEKVMRSNKALRATITRTKNKIAKGLCPCCNEYFADLHAHMTEAHPDYETQKEAEDGS